MSNLPVPKKMMWEYNLSQFYKSKKSILLTGGCSFTASTAQLDSAASWPGFVRDRCRFDHCIDYSYPGSGNEYIGDSILYHLSNLDNVDDYFVIIMWSGINRKEKKLTGIDRMPRLGNVTYNRIMNAVNHPSITDSYKKKLDGEYAQESADKIIELDRYLRSRNIPFAFCSYINLLFPPYIPARDATPRFDNLVHEDVLKQLRLLNWVPENSLDYLYEYAFVNDYLKDSADYFHPTFECNFAWTNNVLLPSLEKQGLITKI